MRYYRYPNVTFFLGAAQPYGQLFKNNPNVICEINRHNNSNKFLDNFDGYDFAISIGGSLYQAHKIADSLKRDVEFFNRFIVNGKPLFIIGSNFDRNYGNAPYTEKDFHDLFARGDGLLKVSLRDKHSANFFRDLANVTCAPDVIFGLSDSFAVPEEARAGLGISVISPTLPGRGGTLKDFHGQYLDGMVALVRSAISKNIGVKIFSFCLKEDDAVMVEEIARNLTAAESTKVQHVTYNGDIENFLKTFAGMKYIVATRFHANVLALKFRQNLFPIVYNDKTLNLLEDLGVFTREDFYDLRDGNTLDADKVWRSLEKPKDWLAKVTEYARASNLHFRELDKYLATLSR